MGISLGVMVEDVPYRTRDNGGNWRDMLFCSVAMAAAKATTMASSSPWWPLWRLDNILNPFMTGF